MSAPYSLILNHIFLKKTEHMWDIDLHHVASDGVDPSKLAPPLWPIAKLLRVEWGGYVSVCETDLYVVDPRPNSLPATWQRHHHVPFFKDRHSYGVTKGGGPYREKNGARGHPGFSLGVHRFLCFCPMFDQSWHWTWTLMMS